MKFYRKDKESKVYWVVHTNTKGIHEFSFDKKKVYNLFRDYPYELTEEEKRIFDECEPFWARFFNKRTKDRAGTARSVFCSIADQSMIM